MAILIENIDQFNNYFYQTSCHPMISVGDLSKASLSLFDPIDFGMYCVILMDEDFGELVKADKCIRYKKSTMFTLKPGEVVSMNLDKSVSPKGMMLAFRPELLENTGLGRDFYMFNFFDYEVSEAVELFDDERDIIKNCFDNIWSELHHTPDRLSSHLLRLGIGQMLSYCKRFYDRQFDTKKMHTSDLTLRLTSILDNYLSGESDLPHRLGPPTVAWCAKQFHLSPNYFGDVVRKDIGCSAQEYIQNKIVDKAKELLSDRSHNVNSVSAHLGFSYPNHFSRLFKVKTGQSPLEYRKEIQNH